MLTVLLSAIQRLEHFSIQGGFGALLSVAGTIVAVGASSSNGISIIHVSALILGVVFLAQGSVVVKHYPRNSPIITNGLAMTVGAIILAFASFITRESWVVPSQINTWAALSYLVFFVSFIALLLYLQVLNRWTASGSSYGFVIIPFVTVIISTFLTGEHITLNFLMGLLLVIIGVIIGALIPKKVELTKECATC
jgi:drug/metabolite transporter (DMT)-like permease